MDVGTNDMRPIFCQNFFRKHTLLLRFSIKIFQFFPLWTNLQKIKDFWKFYYNFYRRKKVEFCYKKISIEMCIFLSGFLQNIGLTSLGPVSMLILKEVVFYFLELLKWPISVIFLNELRRANFKYF